MSMTNLFFSGCMNASSPSLIPRRSAISFGMRTEREFPVLVILVVFPNPQTPFFLADSSIDLVVASSVKDSPHFEQTSAGNVPRTTPNISSVVVPFFNSPFSHIGHFMLPPWLDRDDEHVIVDLFENDAEVLVIGNNLILELDALASCANRFLDFALGYSSLDHLFPCVFAVKNGHGITCKYSNYLYYLKVSFPFHGFQRNQK